MPGRGTTLPSTLDRLLEEFHARQDLLSSASLKTAGRQERAIAAYRAASSSTLAARPLSRDLKTFR